MSVRLFVRLSQSLYAQFNLHSIYNLNGDSSKLTIACLLPIAIGKLLLRFDLMELLPLLS